MPSSLPRWPARSDRSWDGLFQPFPCSPAATAFPMLVQGRRTHWTFRGLLDVHSRYGLPVRRTASRYVCLEGSDGFVTSTAAPIATGWSDPDARRDSRPLKIPDFPRRTLAASLFHSLFGLRHRFIGLVNRAGGERSVLDGLEEFGKVGRPGRAARDHDLAPADHRLPHRLDIRSASLLP